MMTNDELKASLQKFCNEFVGALDEKANSTQKPEKESARKGMISKETFEPVCWIVEQFDYSTKETLRRIIWEKPEFLIGAEVKPVHFISEKKKPIPFEERK